MLATFFGKSYYFWKKLLFLKKDTFFGKVTYFGKSNSFSEKVTFSRKSNFFWEKLLFSPKLASSTLVHLPPGQVSFCSRMANETILELAKPYQDVSLSFTRISHF